MTPNTFRWSIVIVCSFLLGSCSWFGGGKATAPPSTTPYKMVIHAGKAINPSKQNQSNPVVISIYQLSKNTPFNQADPLSLYKNDAKLLANSLISKQTLTPLLHSEKRSIELDIQPTCQFIGVFVQFSNTIESKSLSTIKLDRKQDVEYFDIHISLLSITANTVLNHTLWHKIKRSFSWL